MVVRLYTNTAYKYGVGNKTIDVIFRKEFINVQITNDLCKGDPCYGSQKYICDLNMNIICKEYDFVNILNANKRKCTTNKIIKHKLNSNVEKHLQDYVHVYIGTLYKYGLNNVKTIDVTFSNANTNTTLTNNLCGSDPVYGELKYLYDINWNIVCKENDNIKIINSDEKFRKNYLDDISNRLTKINHVECNIDVYVINLKHRTDRLEHIKKEFSRLDFINLIIFEAFYEQPGRIGCGKSHLALINYAKKRNMNCIFVVEDDCNLKNDISVDEYKEIFNILNTQHENYEIFNGGPGFFDNDQPNKFDSFIKDYFFVTDCQQAQFMCYTSKGFDKILKEYDPYGTLHCDQYYARNYLQLVYKRYICNQIVSRSNIANKISHVYNNINNSENNIYINHICNSFDIDFYKKFNTDLKFQSDIEYIKNHYSHNRHRFINEKSIPEKYIPEIYQMSNLDTLYINQSINDGNVFKQNIIKTRSTETNINFDNTFFDFDIFFYKIYNPDLQFNSDVLYKKHFFYIGQFERRQYNNKIKIVIACNVHNPNACSLGSGADLACYNLAHTINNLKNDKIYAKLLPLSNVLPVNEYCNNIAHVGEINNNTIVIYPEGWESNLFNASHVLRWILLELGIYRPISFYKTWNKTDLVYHWECTKKAKKQLCVPKFNCCFTKYNNTERDGTCYLFKKRNLQSKCESDLNIIHDKNSMCLDKMNMADMVKVLNSKKIFFCYDLNTYIAIGALYCGCKVVIVPINGLSKEEYIESLCFNTFKPLYNMLAYGKEDLKNVVITEQTLELLKEYIVNMSKNSVDSLLQDISNYFFNGCNGLPTVEDIYYT